MGCLVGAHRETPADSPALMTQRTLDLYVYFPGRQVEARRRTGQWGLCVDFFRVGLTCLLAAACSPGSGGKGDALV